MAYELILTFLNACQSWVLGKVVRHRETLSPLLQSACHLVNQETFNRTATELGLLETPSQDPTVEGASAVEKPSKPPRKVSGVVDTAFVSFA